MKKFILTVIATLTFSVAFNQVEFIIFEPEEIRGAYDLTYTTPAGGWGSPDMTDPVNAVNKNLAYAKDGSTADSLACGNIVTDVTGKIAILYRGGCEFSQKALNVENAGAIACVIINNSPEEPVGMAPGNYGASVTIPVVMIGLADGQKILEKMKTEDVNLFIGNKTGFFDNDLVVRTNRALRAIATATPSSIAETGEEYNFEVGAWVFNDGVNSQTNVTLKAIVRFGTDKIYEEVSGFISEIPSGDSAFVTLPTFSASSYGVGKYELIYEVNSSLEDDYIHDNKVSTYFNINDDFMFAYSTIDDDTGLPTSSGIGYRSTLESCIVFRDSNASRLKPMGVTFSAFKGPDAYIPSMEGEPVNIRVIEWNDPFIDLNDNVTYDDLNEVLWEEYIYPEDLGSTPVTAEIEPFQMDDNKRYLFCVSTYNENIYISYDERTDYTENVNTYLQPFSTVIDLDNGSYYPAGFGFDVAPSIGVNMGSTDNISINGTANKTTTCGANDGSIDVTLLEAENYDYSVEWTGSSSGSGVITSPDTDYSIQNLEAGAYNVTVTNTYGFSAEMDIIVGETGAPETSINIIEEITCNEDAVIEITSTDDLSAYTFTWSNGESGASITTGAGYYSVEGTGGGCTIVDEITLLDPKLNIDATVSEPSLCGETDASINIEILNPEDYDYSLTWAGSTSGSTTISNPDNQYDILDLEAGDYLVTVTNSNGCSIDSTISIKESNPPQTALVISNQLNCNDDEDGVLEIISSDDISNYIFTWNTGENGTSVTGGAGDYSYEGSNGNINCDIQSGTVTLTAPEELLINEQMDYFGTDSVNINITVSGGVGQYLYLWEGPGGFTSTDQNVTVTDYGTYTVTVTDENGCVIVESYLADIGSVASNTKHKINVYPNPASKKINFDLTSAESKAIHIFDMTGKAIGFINTENKSEIIEFDVEHLQSGIYIYHIFGPYNSQITTSKFTIIK